MNKLNRKFIPVIAVLTALWVAAPDTSFAQANEVTKGYAPVNGLEMYYEIYGEGEPVVLLHGSFMTIGMNWEQIIPRLSKNHKVIALEMQGHGRTADVNRPFSYPSLASDVAALLEHLEIENADVIGYSLGGTVAMQLAIQNPELVDRLVLISTVYKLDGWLPQVKTALKSMKPEFFDNTPPKTAYDSLAPDPDHWHTFVSKLLALDQKPFNLGEENVQHISAPALLIMGDNDGVDLDHVASMYRMFGGGVFGDMEGLPKSQLAIIPASTHVSLMMKTDKLLSIITPFLNPKTSSDKNNH